MINFMEAEKACKGDRDKTLISADGISCSETIYQTQSFNVKAYFSSLLPTLHNAVVVIIAIIIIII